ncbi:MAG: FAD-binding oxidoreductase [Terriglobia bacterium]
MLTRFMVEETVPKHVFAPATKQEIGQVLCEARSQKWSLVPYGAGVHQHIGNRLQRYDAALSLEKFNQILEYEPQDMVVNVQSGCRLIDLQARLAQDHLFLPIDPCGFEQATVGGIIATNASGPLRFAHGTVRDYLLGIGLVQPDGKWTKFGARVVKNVTGYDMCKLYVGSFGTLGVFTDFFFKLKPYPPSSQTVIVRLKGIAEARLGAEKLIQSPLTPAAYELLNPEATRILKERFPLVTDSEHYVFVVRFMDLEKSVDWQVRCLEEKWKGIFDEGILLNSPQEQETIWRLLREDSLWQENPDLHRVKLKVSCGSMPLFDCLQRLEAPGRRPFGVGAIKIHIGCGVIRAYYQLEGSPESLLSMAKFIQELRTPLIPSRGTVVLETGPSALKESVDVWGYDFKDKFLMQKIRDEFDPQKILNPGRYVV